MDCILFIDFSNNRFNFSCGKISLFKLYFNQETFYKHVHITFLFLMGFYFFYLKLSSFVMIGALWKCYLFSKFCSVKRISFAWKLQYSLVKFCIYRQFALCCFNLKSGLIRKYKNLVNWTKTQFGQVHFSSCKLFFQFISVWFCFPSEPNHERDLFLSRSSNIGLADVVE